MENDGVTHAPFVPMLLPPDTPALSGTRWFWVQEDRVAIGERQPEDSWPRHFLGMLGAEACWGVDVPADATVAEDMAPSELRALWGDVPDVVWTVAGRAIQLVAWGRTHRYCGRCGRETAAVPGERAVGCRACGLLAFPRLAPAVITLVHRRTPAGDEVLLARGVHLSAPMYSCLAGFVEPGETLEEAAGREVREEVGVTIAEPRYMGSQPWPFPHSLMIGFFAEWRGGEIEIDPVEIADAAWFRPDALPMVPPGLSIARRLIDTWLAGCRDPGP